MRKKTHSETWCSGTGGVLLEKMFLEISQNSQENTGVRAFNYLRVSFKSLVLEKRTHFVL